MRLNRFVRPLFLLGSIGAAFLTFAVMPGSARHACAADSHTVNAGASADIDEHGECFTITNSSANNIFVPTKTAGEWTSFQGSGIASISVDPCVTAPFGGWLVASAAAKNGNFGGTAGAVLQCVNELTANDWKGKSDFDGTLGIHNVKPFLCNQYGCNNLKPDSQYAYARAGSPALGGATFVTDATGAGPNNAKRWSDADAFGFTGFIFTGRTPTSSTDTAWATAPGNFSGNYCNDWTGHTSGFNNNRGYTDHPDKNRWSSTTNENCGSTAHYACIVDASAQDENDDYPCLSLAVGSIHACAIGADRRMYCWGDNADEQLGDSSTNLRSTPIRSIDRATSGFYRYVAAGQYHSCAIGTDSHAYCWGDNNNKSAIAQGMLGDGTAVSKDEPVKVVNGASPGTFKRIAAGQYHTCALGTDDRAYCWGTNNFGQLGDNSTTTRLSPVAVVNGAGPGTYKRLSVKGNTTCAIGTDNKGYCWGHNASYQIGDNTNTNRSSPTLVLNGASPGVFKEIAAGTSHSCAIGIDDKAYCWGTNTNRQIGDNTGTTRQTPVLVQNGQNSAGTYKKIYAGNGTTHAIGTDDKAYGWGQNTTGQVGDGTTTTPRGTPRTVVNGASPGTFIDISGTDYAGTSACAVGTDGKVYCWGVNGSSQLGNGNTTQQTSPVLTSNGAGSGDYLQCQPDAVPPVDHFFVQTASAWDGNLGGMDGANEKCLMDLTANNFKGKYGLTINANTVKAFLCNRYYCNNLIANKTYKFAKAGDMTAGGATFTTDASAQGPGNTTAWSGATYLNGNSNYWSNRARGTSTLWVNSPRRTSTNDACEDWTSGGGNNSGEDGSPVSTNENRWAQGTPDCDANRRLMCIVDSPTKSIDTTKRNVFVTSVSYTGDLDNVAGANAICQTHALAGGLPGTYYAWVSSSTNYEPVTYLEQAAVPYRLPNGTIVADNWTDLTDGTIDNPINRDEYGALLGSAQRVWTNTNATGQMVSNWDNCGNWLLGSGSRDSRTGLTSETGNRWTDDTTRPCDGTARLYCFEQQFPPLDNSLSCTNRGGHWIGNYCWFQSASSQSCDSRCAQAGGYSCNLAGTRDYVGSGGSNANCNAVNDAFGGNGTTTTDDNDGDPAVGLGCIMGISDRWRVISNPTTCSAYYFGARRACACGP